MHKIFNSHHIYTVAVGLIVFGWIFTRPALVPREVSRNVSTTAKSDQTVGARSDQVATVKPVATTTIVARSSSLQKQPDVVADELITGSIDRLVIPDLAGTGELLRVKANNLRMRSGPSSSAPTIETYPRGTTVEKIGVKGEWIEVRNGLDGNTGWMSAGYLTPAQ